MSTPKPENGGPVRCEDIQDALFEYMTRELGSGRSDLIRQHLRRCEACQAAALRIQETLEVLRRASRDREGLPTRLSRERRALIVRALTHPLLDWAYRHHTVVSIAAAALVLGAALAVLHKLQLWRYEPPERGIPIWEVFQFGPPPTNAPPAEIPQEVEP